MWEILQTRMKEETTIIKILKHGKRTREEKGDGGREKGGRRRGKEGEGREKRKEGEKGRGKGDGRNEYQLQLVVIE